MLLCQERFYEASLPELSIYAHPPSLQFLLDGLLADKMLEHKRAHTLNLALDPSSELIWITMLLIQWYSLTESISES